MINKRTALAAFVAITAAAPSHAAVTISTAPTQNMTCSSGVCAPTATNATLNVNDLENLLAAANLEVTTTGSGVQANDIDVGAAFGWSSTSVLALDAYRSITIGNAVAVAGLGGLSLTTKDGGAHGKLSFVAGGNVAFANASSSLQINHATYLIVNDISTLASAIASNPAGKYALGNTYDASGDGTYGHDPIPTTFTGTLQGLGNSISNLSIESVDSYAGLFAQTGAGARILNLALSNVSVAVPDGGIYIAVVGTLVGQNGGMIANCYAAGTVNAANHDEDNVTRLGGMVGVNDGSIEWSTASVTMRDGKKPINVDNRLGGLVSDNIGAIRHSFASGPVFGGATSTVGGLVAENATGGFVSGSRASGSVSVKSTGYAGGLVGSNSGWILESSASGSTAVNDGTVGGLIASNAGLVERSFSTSAVSVGGARGTAGGLEGTSSSGTKTADSYASGDVKAARGTQAVIGGFVGNSFSTIRSSYESGAVSSMDSSYKGGFAGVDASNNGINRAYWDTTTSRMKKGTGNRGNEPGLKGQTTAQLQSALPKGFSAKIWAEDSSINNGLPYLISNPPPK